MPCAYRDMKTICGTFSVRPSTVTSEEAEFNKDCKHCHCWIIKGVWKVKFGAILVEKGKVFRRDEELPETSILYAY